MTERVSLVFVQKGQIDVKDGAFVVIDEPAFARIYPLAALPALCLSLVHGFRIMPLHWLQGQGRC